MSTNSVEDALAADVAERYDGGWFLNGWVAVTAWAGIDEDGDEAARIVVHLRDGQLAHWQVIGLLRAALMQVEREYGGGSDAA